MNDKIIKIGGEFEINPKLFNGYSKFCQNRGLLLFANGRSALLAILNYISINKKSIIYIPYYICESVYLTCLNANYEVEFYELDDKFHLPVENIKNFKANSTVLIVNYFGFTDSTLIINMIKEKRKDIAVIYDCVQSLFNIDSSQSDFSFTSLRKWFPTPDGALVFSKDLDFFKNQKKTINTFYKDKLIASLLKYAKINDQDYLNIFESAEKKIETENGVRLASKFSHYIYSKINREYIKRRRIKNYSIIYEMGYKLDIPFLFEYKEGIVPLCIPIVIDNRDQIRKRLMSSDIFLPIHWRIKNYNESSDKTKEICDKELSLLIDQRYSNEEIKFQLKTIKKVLKDGNIS